MSGMVTIGHDEFEALMDELARLRFFRDDADHALGVLREETASMRMSKRLRLEIRAYEMAVEFGIAMTRGDGR